MVQQISQLLGLGTTNNPVSVDPADNPNLRGENLPLPPAFVTGGSRRPQGGVAPGSSHQTDTFVQTQPRVMFSQSENVEEDVPDLDEMDKLSKVKEPRALQLI
ncbi:hypothetical protein V6N12_046374 [Hibiscus sabdariffa]|uniref:Uncharacterized protein n=1 Tax=Hibiscus sabdariffa TaxID=183260 RepID=A0ABR2DJF8_9ROSI